MLLPVPVPSFHCDARSLGDTTTLLPEGELDVATVPLLDEALRDAETAATVVLDLRGLTFIDSEGIRLLLTWHRRSEAAGRALRLVPGPDAVQRVFALTGVTEALGFEPA
jgi:anti-anti-sigma factor